jgi:diadenosine tetraphosphate (Ap4A) HIT family hydrolase
MPAWTKLDLMSCPFCSIAPERALLESDSIVAFLDAFPLTEGHTLVTPRKHVSSIYDLSPSEQCELREIVAKVRTLLMERFEVDSLNIGVNDGLAAGQTVAHAHVHVIPRRTGDVPDPRGGIRWVVADKARYWS